MVGTKLKDDVEASALQHVVRTYSDQMLAAYREHPPLVDEHAGLEENIAQGGYGRRQIHELIQNGADELIAGPGGRIDVVLTGTHLYCANQGSPISEAGVAAILLAHVSPKRGDEIGRFGLGFKSVLGVTSRPEFFSRPVSFGFDRRWASEQIASVVSKQHEAYPTLRIARLLDLDAECQGDEILAELMSWATTVVRLPLDDGAGWLAGDIETFDKAFLLFSPHVGALTLEDRTAGLKRSIRMERDGDDLLLEEDKDSQRWRVFRTELEPSERARREAGKLQHRGKLPIVWAVPVEGRLEVGQFWAFFPLRDQTTLKGIVNAPWQVNDDRTGLLENSKLNEELLQALVELTFDALPDLVTKADPGRVLDLMPARGREARCWGDGLLTALFNEERANRSVVPDQSGVLRRINQLKVPPLGIPADAHQAWSQHRGRPVDWVHPTAFTSPTRRSRIQELLGVTHRTSESPAVWLEALLDEAPGAAESAEAIMVAAVAARHEEFDALEEGLCDAHVVLNSSGQLSRLHPKWIWINTATGSRAPAVVVVHDDVVNYFGALLALTDMGILPVTPLLELEALLSEADGSDGDAWETIWTIAREVEDDEESAAALRRHTQEHGPFMVRSGDGSWKPSTEVLLPGRVIQLGASTGQSVVVDGDYHSADLDLLRKAGMSDGPTAGGNIEDDPRTRTWRSEVLDEYERFLNRSGARPSRVHLEVNRSDVPRPIGVLPRLRGDDCARFVALLFEVPGALEPRLTRHSTSTRYPEQPCDSPVVWAVKAWGHLATSRPSPASESGSRPVSGCVGPGLAAHHEVLPVADVSDQVAERLGLPQTLDRIPRVLWYELLAEAIHQGPAHLGALFALAVEAEIAPILTIDTGGGPKLATSQIVVAMPRDDVDTLAGLGRYVAVVSGPQVAEVLTSAWGLQPAHDFFRTEVMAVEPSEPIAALDLFPDLAALEPRLADLQIVCSEEVIIERSSDEGTVEQSVSETLDGSVLYVVADPQDEEAILDALVAVKGWELTADERKTALGSRRTAGARELRKTVLKAATIEKKVLLAIGRDALIRRMPKQIIDEMSERRGGTLSDKQTVELALAIHGVEILRIHRDDLLAKGLDVPSSWAGGRAARRFVLDLGFPEEYAGFPGASRDALLLVQGPPEMPALHDFQSESAKRIRDLLRDGSGRGMLSLPTGAGKTRTAVQAIVEAMRDGELKGPVLWVAQTDELCEQAVSAWSDNWRAVGPRETLKLARLWSNNEAQDLHDSNQVVVATIAKLNAVMGRPRDYEWLSKANAVVVDEAHRAISPDYTRLLDWLGMGRGKERAPLIGLSATPYRGISEQQTQALVNRFNGKRLDSMGDDPYGLLQDMGVLSRVDHKLLAGADVALDADELEALQQTRRLPPAVLARIGEDKGRNQTILDSILALDDNFTVLLFAASVPHAELMAGLLSAEGVPSRAISSRTDRGARHHYVEQFRAGEIRVLTNFGVLTEGFDAPAVRAVYVARPTYSPNLYQQMIGRGLRGPLNGGKEVCLIVNVADNLAAYGESLAFEEWEHLWGGANA